jgi:UDPglucose--hexose-1-phosphate uridylyltransferase
VALPYVPAAITRETEAMGEACLLCRLGQAVDEDLVVEQSDEIVALCPTWSSTGYEMLIAPRRHEARFEDADDDLIAKLAGVLYRSLARLDAVAQRPPFTLVLHSAPRGDPGTFHWHVHVWPRREPAGGVEWGLGFNVAPVRPEVSASRLRAATTRD